MCRWFLESLDRARGKRAFDLWAFVIMPEHVHLLIWPRTQEYSISRILYDIKHPFSLKVCRYFRKHAPVFLQKMRDEQPNGKVCHRFWQRGGGYDRNLLEPEVIRATLDYIHANPVRRGLVDSPEDWRWSSAAYYARNDPSALVPDSQTLYETIG